MKTHFLFGFNAVKQSYTCSYTTLSMYIVFIAVHLNAINFPVMWGVCPQMSNFSCYEVSISECAQNYGLSIESHYLLCDEAPLLLH